MAILCRLPTVDSLASWGMTMSLQCVLCGSCLESDETLFFFCPFAAAICDQYCRRSNFPIRITFIFILLSLRTRLLHWTSSIFYWSIGSFKLLMQIVVYCVWREWNYQIFSESSISEAGVVAQVDRLPRDRLISYPSLSSSHRSLLQVYFSLNHLI